MARSPGFAAPEVSVAVRVKPAAARVRVGGRHDGPHGAALIIAVTAPPVDGRATEAARRALAGVLEVRAGDVRLRVGAASRDKVFSVQGVTEEAWRRLVRLRDGSA